MKNKTIKGDFLTFSIMDFQVCLNSFSLPEIQGANPLFLERLRKTVAKVTLKRGLEIKCLPS
ncbi:hypothetical protein [Salmonella sp. s55884]|uniref:hypothetical protein n=1 Tax=Salmonella sp. s55884 TaxID=3159683 RepID=UPI00397F41BC